MCKRTKRPHCGENEKGEAARTISRRGSGERDEGGREGGEKERRGRRKVGRAIEAVGRLITTNGREE